MVRALPGNLLPGATMDLYFHKKKAQLMINLHQRKRGLSLGFFFSYFKLICTTGSYIKVQNPGLTLQKGRTQVPFLLHPNPGRHHPRPGAELPLSRGHFPPGREKFLHC